MKTIKLGVFRRFDEGNPKLKNPPTALELHQKRQKALHEVLDQAENIKMVDWGDTDDTKPHEFVEMVIGIAGTALFNYVVVPGLKYVGGKLVEKAIDEGTSELVKWLISKLRPKQEAKEILDYRIITPDGTEIRIGSPDMDATISIHYKNGKFDQVKYDVAQ